MPGTMLRTAFARASIALATALLLALPLPALAQAGGEGGVSLPIGTVAPTAALQDLEGKAVDLASYVPRGKPAIIEFWATWCELCEALQPQLDQIQAMHGDEVNIVAVAVGVAQTVRRIQRHLEGHDPGYPYLFDARGAAVRAFNATTTSIVVMLDAEGKVAYTGVGAQQDLRRAVERLLAG
jgi:thiol-disulfide isomerase/thioredoxin